MLILTYKTLSKKIGRKAHPYNLMFYKFQKKNEVSLIKRERERVRDRDYLSVTMSNTAPKVETELRRR